MWLLILIDNHTFRSLRLSVHITRNLPLFSERRSKQVEAWSTRDGNCIYQTWLPSDSSPLGEDRKSLKPLVFYFDHVFSEDKDNAYVYDHICKHVVEAAMQGYHGCVFAYGQVSGELLFPSFCCYCHYVLLTFCLSFLQLPVLNGW